MKNLTSDEKSELFHYGMLVSCVHDVRYYSKEGAEKDLATPKTCPENIKIILIKEYGDSWVELFWGKDYFKHFPELK